MSASMGSYFYYSFFHVGNLEIIQSRRSLVGVVDILTQPPFWKGQQDKTDKRCYLHLICGVQGHRKGKLKPKFQPLCQSDICSNFPISSPAGKNIYNIVSDSLKPVFHLKLYLLSWNTLFSTDNFIMWVQENLWLFSKAEVRFSS